MEQRKQAFTTEHETYTIGALITTDGAGDPTLSHNNGILSVSKTAAGTYKLILKDRWYRLVAAHATVKMSAANLDSKISAHDVDHATAPYITVLTHTGTGAGSATATNIAATTGATVDNANTRRLATFAGSLPAPGVTMHAQVAGGAALDLAAGWTNPLPRRGMTITRSAAGPASVDYTVYMDTPDGGHVTQVVAVASGGSGSTTYAGEVTRVTTTVDPVSTSDFVTAAPFCIGAIFTGTPIISADGVVEALVASEPGAGSVTATTATDGTTEFCVMFNEPHSHTLTDAGHNHNQNAHTHTAAGAAADLVSGEIYVTAMVRRR